MLSSVDSWVLNLQLVKLFLLFQVSHFHSSHYISLSLAGVYHLGCGQDALVQTRGQTSISLLSAASSLSWTKWTENPEWQYRHSRKHNEQHRVPMLSKVRRLQAPAALTGLPTWHQVGPHGAVCGHLRNSRAEEGREDTAGAGPFRAEQTLEGRHSPAEADVSPTAGALQWRGRPCCGLGIPESTLSLTCVTEVGANIQWPNQVPAFILVRKQGFSYKLTHKTSLHSRL